MLSQNLTYLRRKHNKSQDFVAKEVGVTRQALIKYEQGTAEPKASILKKLAAFYNAKLDLLMNSNLAETKSVATDSILNPHFRILTVSVTDTLKEKIELVPIEAQAGYLQAFQTPTYISSLPTFSLPKHHTGKYRAFEIKGDSMPPINQGFIVIGQYVESWTNIKSDKRYILITKSEGIIFKRVYFDKTTENNLILVSDNKEYSPYSLHANELAEAWLFVSFIGFSDK